MIHASILTLIIALAIGLAVTVLAALFYFQFRTKPLLAHLRMVTSINLLVLVYIATLYFYQNLLRDVPASYSAIVDSVTQVVVPALQILALVSLLNLAGIVLGNVSPFPGEIPVLQSTGAIVILQTTLVVWQPYIGDVPVLFVVFKTVEYSTLCGAYCVLILLFLSAKKVQLEAKRRLIKKYSLIFVVLLTILLACAFAREFSLIIPSAHALVGAIVVVAANLVPLFCRGMFFATGFGALGTFGANDLDVQELRHACNISPREQEVLELVCEGRSNREIADILYLSVQTVKDHTSRIYRKIGVKNRAQLVSVLKSPNAENRNFDK